MSCQIETNPSALTTMCLNPGVQMRIEDSIVMMARQPRSLLRPQLNWLNTKSPIDVKYFGQVLLLDHRVLIWAGSYFEPEPAKKFTCKALKQISELTIPHRWDCISISQESLSSEPTAATAWMAAWKQFGGGAAQNCWLAKFFVSWTTLHPVSGRACSSPLPPGLSKTESPWQKKDTDTGPMRTQLQWRPPQDSRGGSERGKSGQVTNWEVNGLWRKHRRICEYLGRGKRW